MAKKIMGCRQLLITLLLFTPALLMGQHAGACGCGEVSITGEGLYWGTSQSDFFYAVVGESTFVPDLYPDANTVILANTQNQVVEPDYDWGLRIGIHYARDRWFARARYLWLETNSTKTSQRGDLNTMYIPIFTGGAQLTVFFETAVGSTEEIYQNFDLAIGHEICRTCRSDFSLLGSVESICIRDRRRVTAVGEAPFPFEEPRTETAPISGRYEMDTNFLGIGLGFGGQGRAQLGCGFSVVGEAALVGLIGYKRVEVENRALHNLPIYPLLFPPQLAYVETRLPARQTSRSCTVPGLKGRLSLEYCYDLCCGTLCANIGYESHFYYGAVETSQDNRIAQDRPSNLQAITENAGFGGLTLGASFSY